MIDDSVILITCLAAVYAVWCAKRAELGRLARAAVAGMRGMARGARFAAKRAGGNVAQPAAATVALTMPAPAMGPPTDDSGRRVFLRQPGQRAAPPSGGKPKFGPRAGPAR